MHLPMPKNAQHLAVAGLLALTFFLAGGAALRESATVDEVVHIGAGLSYLQRLDLRLNPEHPPLAKVLAALPLLAGGTHADYSAPAWKVSGDFFAAYGAQWVFGDAVLGRWNSWRPTLLWARMPMLVLTLLLGWILYCYGSALGGVWGGLLSLAAYVTTPTFLVFGLLVITDVPVVLFSLVSLWRLAAIWTEPTRRNALFFGFATAGALLTKFTGLLIFPVVLVLFVQTRFWPPADQPVVVEERRTWRRVRLRTVLRGFLWAVLVVYGVYFLLSWNQPDDALNRIGIGAWAWLLRRPLLPLWLYCRGLLLMLAMGSRSTFLFGHTYPHGVPFYFPVVFVLKSTLGFLLLLVLMALVGVLTRRHGGRAIPETFRAHWRVLNVGLWVFVVVCLLSRLDISVRHFMVPMVLLILMLATLPRMMQTLPRPRFWQALAGALVMCCFVPVLRAYPYFFPFVNSLALGHPVYSLINDSNVTWNEGLPAVESFAQQQHLSRIEVDWASLSDPKLVVPEAQSWDCQAPSESDAGQWVAVSAVCILENHNCGYLRRYPQRELAGGAFYAFQLPTPIPPPGAPGGPPLPAARQMMWGMSSDMREWSIHVERHPEQLESEMRRLMRQYQEQPKASVDKR